MYNPNVPSSNMGIAPISGQPSQPMGPAPMAGSAPMGPMGPPPPMMGGMPPPPMMAPPPMAPPIAPITEGLGGFGGSSAGRAGFSERMQRMTSPPKPKPMQQPQQMQQPVQGMSYGGMVGQAAQEAGSTQAQRLRSSIFGIPNNHNDMNGGMSSSMMPYMQSPYQNFGMPQQGSANALNQYGEYLDDQYGDPQFEQKRNNFLQGIAREEQQTFGGMGGYGGQPNFNSMQREQSLLDNIYGSGGLSNYQVARPMANGGSVSSDPVKMALGGFIGNPTTRDYSDDDYTDPYEELDDLYDDIGGYDPTDPFGDSGGGDGDGPVADLVYIPAPTPAPPVVVPPPEESGGDGDIQDRVIADLVYGPADPTVGSSDPSVPDVAPDFGTFTDSIDPYGSLTGQVVSPTASAVSKSVDAVGAAPIVGAVESGEGEGVSTEVDVLGVNPISLSSSGITDRGKGMTVREMIASGSGNPNNVVFDTSNIPAVDSDFTARRAGEILDSLNVARPGGSSKTRIEDAGYANAMAAAQQVDAASSAVKAAGGSSVNSDIDYPDSMTIGEIVADQANRRAMAEARADDAAPFDTKTFGGVGPVGSFRSSYPDGTPAPNVLLNYVTREGYNPTSSLGLDPDPSDIQLEMAQPTDGGYQPNLRRGPFGPIGPESSFPGLGKVNSLALPADAVFPEAKPEQIGGGLAGASTRPGMGSDDPIVYNDTPSGPSTGLTSDPSDPYAGYNPPVFAPSTDTMDAMGRGMPSTPYSDPYAGDIVTTDVRTDLGIGTPYFRVGDPIDETTQKMLDGSPLEGAMLGEALTQSDVTFLNSPEMNIFASADPTQTVPVPADTDSADTTTGTDKKDEKIAPTKPYAESDYKSPGVLDDYVDPYEDQFVKDSYEQQLFGDPPKTVQAFGGLVKLLSGGLIDINKLTAEHRRKGLKAYLETNELAYENGVVVGVKDPEGRTIYLGPQSPKEEDNIGGDDDGCPPGFRKVNGVCTPIQRIARNPATAISDSINKATLPVIPLPSTLRPVVRDVVDDDDEEETSDVGGLTIRRPSYFAGGGAVSEGMGSAIDSFLSSMGGSVKKKSNVAPVGMARGGYVDMKSGDGSTVKDGFGNPVRTRVTTSSMSESDKDERNFSYDPFPDDVYGRGGRGVDNDPVAPAYNFYADPAAAPVYPDIMSSGFFDPEPEPDNIVQRSLRPQLRPASFDPYVSNAISSVQDNYNDGSVGPTMQNAAALPKQETFMQGISNYLPESVNSAFMLGPNYDQSVFGAAGEMGGELATSFYDNVIGPEGKPLEYLGGAAVDLGQSVFDTLYDPPKAVYGAVDSVFDAFGRLGTETNARDRVGNIIGGPLAAATAVTPLGRLGKLTPKNNTISTNIKPTFKDLNLAHGTPRTDPFKPEIQVQMADGTTQFMDMFSPDGFIETKFTSGFPEGAKVVGDYPFGRFSTDFIGAGEGRMLPGSSASSSNPKGAAFGKGTYFAENPELSSDVYRFIGQNQYKPDGLPKKFNLDAALRQKQGIINKYGSPEEALEAFESGKVISKPDYNSVSQAYFQGAENALNSDNPILSKISSDLMSGMEPSYRAKLERLKIEKPEEWQTIISNHINERISSIRKKGREDQLAKGQKIVDNPDIQKASNILNKNAMDTRNKVYDEKASYDAMLQIMQSNVPGSTKRATINESKLGRSLDLDSPSAVGDTRIGFDKNVRQDMLDIFGEAWVADRESGMFADPNNPGNLLRGAPNQTDYRTEGAYAPRTVEEMNKLADAGYSHLSFYDGKSREVHRRATKRMQDIQKQLEGTTLERYLSYANKNNPQDVAEMTKLYEVEVANLENEMKKARESLTGLTKNYVFFDDKTMPKITESYAKGGQVGMGLGSL